MTNSRKIAVILEGRVQYERNVLLGIRDFAESKTDWLLRLERPGPNTIQRLRSWNPDGILFQSAGLSSASITKIARSDRPAVHLSEPPTRRKNLRSVGLDNREIGRVAAETFLELGFRNFAFAGSKNGFSGNRFRSFQSRLREAGQGVEVIPFRAEMPETEISDRLLALPEPCAVFAMHDEFALILSTLCRGMGIRIPEEIALLGVDDDPLICELAWPQLSSIGVPSRKVGFEAAARLDRIFAGQPDDPGRSILLPPAGVVTRHSTDVHQTADESVNRALRLMRSQFRNRINVDDVLREIG
ncbi:MAG: XylR family transcriptional regulator, partial [Verrucomicrobiales bacterium]|nr:XylR family transcriptional regulator [Verrucomicrobiales bacterium]